MADLNPWLIAAAALLVGLIPCAVVIARGAGGWPGGAPARGHVDDPRPTRAGGGIPALDRRRHPHGPGCIVVRVEPAVRAFPGAMVMSRIASAGVAFVLALVAAFAWACIAGLLRSKGPFARLHFAGDGLAARPAGNRPGDRPGGGGRAHRHEGLADLRHPVLHRWDRDARDGPSRDAPPRG